MIFLDAHAHVYPEYGMGVFFSSLAARARRRAGSGACVAAAVLLRPFQASLGDALASAGGYGGWHLERPGGDGAPWTAKGPDGEVLLFPARQVAAAERLELIGYFGETMVPDGLPLKETARRLAGAGYSPALAWGRGKWLFGRAGIVRDFLGDPEMRGIVPFVCDSALRPWFWPEPLFRLARRNGFGMLSGSDPLPGAGNESNAGRRAMLIDAPAPRTADDLRAALVGAAAR